MWENSLSIMDLNADLSLPTRSQLKKFPQGSKQSILLRGDPCLDIRRCHGDWRAWKLSRSHLVSNCWVVCTDSFAPEACRSYSLVINK